MQWQNRIRFILQHPEVPAKQTMDDTARNELRDTLSASGVEHAVFWDDAAGIFQ